MPERGSSLPRSVPPSGGAAGGIDPEMRPVLASKARLRRDRKSGRCLLLYPERGMELNATGAAIVELCTGEPTVAEIVQVLTERYSPTPGDVIEREVYGFLSALRERALLA
jgi:coenzyme PQQ biosynthesis protein PqqD